MNETSKCHDKRIRCGDFDRYLTGKGIDVGAGPDPLRCPVGIVRVWDKLHGDAQYLAQVADESLDFVYSSHCLEHVISVEIALRNWSRVCRTGGYVYVVVPEWTLYEHQCWPSLHNPEHRSSFSLISCDRPSDHPHFTLADLVGIGNRHALQLADARLDMDGFSFAAHRLSPPFIDQTLHGALAQITLIWQKGK